MRKLNVTFVCLLFLAFSAEARTVPARSAGLITADELAIMLNEGPISVADMRSDIAAYLQGHIPGAVYVHYETLRATGEGVPADLLPDDTYAALFGRLGFRTDRPIVVYSAGDAANFYATFLAWLLEGFGHPSVYVLDGGYDAWVREDKPVERRYPDVEPTTFEYASFNPAVADLAAVKDAVETRGVILVDARPTDQYEGKAGAQMRLGRLPGAISHPWSSDLHDTDHGKVWKPEEMLLDTYRAQGITPDKEIIAYCNTGTEASHVYFALTSRLGFENVRVYVPSYTQWAEIEELPIEVGPGAGR